MPTPSSIGQRFTQLIQHLGLSKNAFAQSLDKTATVIQHLVDERNKPGYDLLCKVFETYPNVSKDWLMEGQGPMLKPDAAGVQPAERTAAAPLEPIDLAELPGLPRPRAQAAGASLQPADIAATLALAATASPARPTASATPAPSSKPTPEPVAAAVPGPAAQAAAAQNEALAREPAPAPAVTAALPDANYLAVLLQTQQLQHQLALAEQRNQHLLEQQQLMQQMVSLLQRAI